MTARPPRVARALISWLTPADDRRDVLADLDETFARLARDRGVAPARRWVRGQLLRSLPLVSHLLAGVLRGWSSGDLKPALRVLRRRPLYALGVAGTLWLGLASAIVVGGIAWRVWLRPLPFPDSGNLVRVYELGRPGQTGERERGRISPPLLRDLQEGQWSSFSGFAGIASETPEWVVDGDMRQLRGSAVAPGFFQLLGVPPLHGRTRWASRNGAEVAEVVLSERFWRQHFGADPDVVGSSIDLGGASHTVIGVVGQRGGYPPPVDVFTPLVFEERRLGEGMRGARFLEVIARVRPGASVEAASAEFAGFIESLGADHPIHDGWSGEVISLREDLAGPFRNVLSLLLAAGGAFLALALVNVAGLTSTRALERRHETGVRRALGASRTRIMSGAWVEGAVLGGLGGGAAVACALFLFPASVDWLPRDLARSGEVGLSWSGGLAWWIVSVAIGGIVAVLGQRVVTGGPDLRSGTRSTPGQRAGRTLVAGQLALTTLLVGVGSVLLEHSRDLSSHPFGFEPREVHAGFVPLPRSTHEDWEARRDAWTGLLAALGDAGIPAAITTNPPMTGTTANYGYARPGDTEEAFGQYSVVSAGYFDVMGIPLVAGRTFEPGESGPVTVISEVLAREHFPGEDPVGQTLRIIGEDHTVIGVVGSTFHFGPDSPEPTAMYVSYEATSWSFAHLVARGGPSVRGAMVEAVARVAPGTTPPDVLPYAVHVENWFRPLRLQLWIVGALALVGALLAGLGLYANIAYQVRGQLPELGIRVVLGASRTRILSGVVRAGLASASVGLLLGFAAWWAGRDRLHQVLGSAEGGLSLFAVALTSALVLALTLVAVALPALRASRADPLDSLKMD